VSCEGRRVAAIAAASGKGADLWQAGTCPPLGVNLLTCDEGNAR
jgi:hypothetical protein